MNEKINIKIAGVTDIEEIFKIYNWYILNTTATLDSEVFVASDQQKWFAQFSEAYPIWAVSNGSKVIGWGCLKKWSDRSGYRYTAELSIYMNTDSTAKGIGSLLMEEIISFASKRGYRTILVRIGGESCQSIEFHKKFGFVEIGVMKSVGEKFGRALDVHMLQRIL